MNVKQCYEALQGNYDEVMGRLLTEERVKKFLLMFLKDDSYSSLIAALDESDYATAFRCAHTLKGTCLNLGLEKLRMSASDVTEALRGDINNGVEALMPTLVADYELTINAIKELDV